MTFERNPWSLYDSDPRDSASSFIGRRKRAKPVVREFVLLLGELFDEEL